MLAFTAHNENKSKTFMSALLSCRTIERSSLQLKETNMFTVFFRSRGFAFVLLQKACKIIAQESRSWIFTLQFFEVKLRWFLTPLLGMMNITVNLKLHCFFAACLLVASYNQWRFFHSCQHLL